mgnify:CR=1 FL=1
MGSVYRAFDRVLDEEVALKVQRGQADGGPEAERRFRSEVKLARQVSHPNVCRLHDGGQEGARRWISMELVPGETLAARLTGRGVRTVTASGFASLAVLVAIFWFVGSDSVLLYRGGFLVIGVAAVSLMFFIERGEWLYAAILFIVANIAVNGSFVASAKRELTPLAPKDEVEIVAPRQGG